MRSHFAASACTKAANASAVMLIGSIWISVSRFAAAGSAVSSRIVALSLSTMLFGVPCGANRANHIDPRQADELVSGERHGAAGPERHVIELARMLPGIGNELLQGSGRHFRVD